ncbi:MAG: tetratricopeptide repeat protein [Anaerolineae bacterium]
MEFLDDILNRDAEDQPEDQREDQQETARPAERESDAWEDLLRGVSYDEPEVETPKPAEKRHFGAKLKLSGTQQIVLGVLGVVVIGVWVGIILLITRSLPARGRSSAAPDGGAQATIVSPDEDMEGEPASRPTETPEPEATPTPLPLFTRYDRQIQEDPTNPSLYVQRAREYIDRAAYRAAVRDLQQAKQLDDEIPALYVELGWAHYYLGEWQAAESAFDTAIALDQDLPRAHFGLGKLYYYEGRYEEAATAFDWAAEIDRRHAEAEAWLAIASARMEDLQEAEGAVTRAMSLTQDLPIVYIARSWARRIQDPPDIDGAQGDLLYAQELEPNDFLTLNALATFYLNHRSERLAEAEQLAVYAQNWAKNSPERAVALHTLGRIYLKQGREPDAYEVLNEAADLISADGQIPLAGLVEDLERAAQ